MKRGTITLTALVLGAFLALGTGACAPDDETIGPPDADAGSAQKPDPESLDAVERAALFVLPAPSEIAAAVEGEGGFDTLRLEDEPLPSYADLSATHRAIALGRVVADLLIAAPTAPTPRLVTILDSLITGLRSMDVDEAQIAEVQELRSEIADGALGREELIDRLDSMRVDILRRGKAELGDQTMALLATGGWARAVYLVSTQILATGQIPESADALKLRLVITTLIDRLGTGDEVRPVVDSLQAILPITTGRPSKPTSDELTLLISETDEILSLARTS